MKKILTWSMAGLVTVVLFAAGINAADSNVVQGKDVYDNNCALCHGESGAGDGPAASSFTPSPANFTKADFWGRQNVDGIISNTIQNGKGAMPPVPLSKDQIQQVIAYISQTFKPSGK